MAWSDLQVLDFSPLWSIFEQWQEALQKVRNISVKGLAGQGSIRIMRFLGRGYTPLADNLTLAVRCYLTVK